MEQQKNDKWNQIALECNQDCYDMLQILLGDTRYWNHVSGKMERDRDGRAVYIAIRNNICGSHANSNLNRTNRDEAEAAYWNGEKRNHTYEMFINKLRHCRKVQEGLALMDKDRFHAFTHDEMWTFLRRGLRSPLARAGVASVLATKELREDFEKA